MKSLLPDYFAAGVRLPACDNNSPTSPTETGRAFAMPLLSSNEPSLPVPNEAPCSGNVTIRFNLTRDSAQVITAGTAIFKPASAPARPALQSPSRTFTVALRVSTEESWSTPASRPARSIWSTVPAHSQRTALAITPASLAQEILDNPSGFYFNIHSQNNPGGVIRAQLLRVLRDETVPPAEFERLTSLSRPKPLGASPSPRPPCGRCSNVRCIVTS